MLPPAVERQELDIVDDVAELHAPVELAGGDRRRARPAAPRYRAAASVRTTWSVTRASRYFFAGAELVSVLLLYALVSWQVFAHEPPFGSFV